MKPVRFSYVRPQTLSEVLALLAEHGSNAYVLAGGQSLMPMLNFRLARPALLVDINAIPELSKIIREDDRICIGATARHNEVLRSSLVSDALPLLTQALPLVAHEAIRNRGTLGGSLALADPAAELPACAVCLGAEIIVASERGERKIAAGNFFEGIYATALQEGEIIVGVEFPVLGPSWRVAFDEVSRRRGDFAIAGLAMAIEVADGKIRQCRIVYSGVEERPRQLDRVEAALSGSIQGAPSRAMLDLLAAEIEPLGGGEYSEDYRRQVALALFVRVLKRLLHEHKG